MSDNLNYIKLKKKIYPDLNSKSFQDHKIISNNKVTGISINFPIGSTCQPSKVCINSCYGLTGPITWSTSLKKQQLNEIFCKKDPIAFAKKINLEIQKYLKNNSLFFLRWNGVGDLFDEAIESIKEFSFMQPNVPIWVVTRIPKYAAKLSNLLLKNVYIHFSLDKKSLDRKNKVESLINQNSKLFFSYQCDKNETYQPLEFISVVFADKYNPKFINEINETICPLNTSEKIDGMCFKCRRCFNGEALKYIKKSTN